jgi:hypothetical protein
LCGKSQKKTFRASLKNQEIVGISPVAGKLFDVMAFFIADLIET